MKHKLIDLRCGLIVDKYSVVAISCDEKEIKISIGLKNEHAISITSPDLESSRELFNDIKFYLKIG